MSRRGDCYDCERRTVPNLTLADLSVVQREVALARALGTTPSDCLDLQRISGVGAFPAAFDLPVERGLQ